MSEIPKDQPEAVFDENINQILGMVENHHRIITEMLRGIGQYMAEVERLMGEWNIDSGSTGNTEDRNV